MYEVNRSGQGDKLRLGDGVDLRTIELRSKDRELIGTDVDVVLVDAQERLVAETGAARITEIGCVYTVGCPGRSWVTSGIHGQVDTPNLVIAADEKDDGEPGVGGLVIEAAWVAGKLLEAVIEQAVDVEWTGDPGTIGVVDIVGRVHRLYYETVANAETLVGRLKFSAEVGFLAVAAAGSIEVLEQGTGIPAKLRTCCRRTLDCLTVSRMDAAHASCNGSRCI